MSSIILERDTSVGRIQGAEVDLCLGVKLRTSPSCSGGSTLTRLPYTPLSSHPPACGTLDKHKQKHRPEHTHTHIIPLKYAYRRKERKWSTFQVLRPQLYTFQDYPTFILCSIHWFSFLFAHVVLLILIDRKWGDGETGDQKALQLHMDLPAVWTPRPVSFFFCFSF